MLRSAVFRRRTSSSPCLQAGTFQGRGSLRLRFSSRVEEYERKTPHEHVLLRPGMYIGQVEPSTSEMWVYDAENTAMTKEQVSYSPALLKIFDEILVNAADNYQRGEKMSKIDVNITKKGKTGLRITVKNDGKVIPIAVHEKENMYIPQLIFGNLLTGSNFDDTKAALTGGRHGYGAKLTNIFSKLFEIELYNKKTKQQYKQAWKNNMFVCEEPVMSIGASNGSNDNHNYTSITFEPDLTKFGFGSQSKLNEIQTAALDGTIKMMERRVVDIAACCGTTKDSVVVKLNGKVIPITGFESYVGLFNRGVALSSLRSSASAADDIKYDNIDAVSNNITYIRANDRCEVAVMLAPSGTFEQHSFVNSVWTPRGGSHVNVIASQVTNAIEEAINKRDNGKNATNHMIRNRMMIFVRSLVENPQFDSQAKDSLATSSSHISQWLSLPTSYLKKICLNSGIVDEVMSDLDARERSRLVRATSNKGTSKRVDVPKLEDAHFAGTDRAGECSLILTEGDSAKALAVAGLEVLGRDKYGVLPLRGKILNVRGVSSKIMTNNVELTNLIKALGLQFGKVYEGTNTANAAVTSSGGIGGANSSFIDGADSDSVLGVHGQGMRYGKVLIMTDQDPDGAHIKGLLINFFQHFWPSLLDVPGFLQQFITPLVKIKSIGNGKGNKNGTELHSFYSVPEHEAWIRQVEKEAAAAAAADADKEELDGNETSRSDSKKSSTNVGKLKHSSKYQVKYYKGLGTSTAAEGREYFSDLPKHRKIFYSAKESLDHTHPIGIDGQSLDTAGIVDLVFNKNKAKERKDWLANRFNPHEYSDPAKRQISVHEFIDTDLMQFSHADNVRSLPNVIDGLKPAQRKVLYGCFRKKLTNGEEMKVVQLAGYIAEQTAYHHGDTSLHATIINMAQDFVGSNNLPLLTAGGQFGTRAKGGSDFASPRYIFTGLSPLARLLYPEEDDNLLDYNWEDGQQVEPVFFAPILPTLLINGSYGIGTGWSTLIPPHNPLVVAEHTARLIRGESVTHAPLELPMPGKGRPRKHPLKDSSLLHPWIRGFTGDIDRVRDSRGLTYRTRGKINRISKTILEIDELPYGSWTEDYKQVLLKLNEEQEFKRFTEDHTHKSVKFTIAGSKHQLDGLYGEKPDDIYTKLRLEGPLSMRNMHAFNCNGQIQHYMSAEAIAEEHYDTRLMVYNKRKIYLNKKLNYDVIIANNKSRFVRELLSGRLELLPSGGARTTELISSLKSAGFITNSQLKDLAADVTSGETNSSSSNNTEQPAVSDYKYLLDMPIQSLTEERVVALDKSAEDARFKLNHLLSSSPEDLWMRDLDKFINTANKKKDLF